MDDFLVIGGGVAGLSAGAALSALGTVRVLEREAALGHHASGRSAALFEESYGLPSTRALNRASRAHHEAAGVLSPRGLMLVGDPEVAEAYAHDRASMGLEEIGGEDARARVPILSPRVDRAAVHADAFDLDVDRLMQGYAATIRAAGGTVQTGRPVDAVERRPGGWSVLSQGEAFEGRHLVDAAGAWADALAVMAGIAPLGLVPLRRSMARLTAPGGRDVRGWPMIFGPGESWYAKPDAGALLVSPAEEDPCEPHDAWADDMVLAEGLARYEAWVTEPVTRPVATWAGLRTFAPDRNLVIGPDPGAPSFLWCAGQGGYGVQSSPAAGRHLADRVAGRVPEVGADVSAMLDPARLR